MLFIANQRMMRFSLQEIMHLRRLPLLKKLQAFARAIRSDVHKEYYLAELVEKGVAYHKGVNLPAENLSITSFRKGLSNFSEVDFKNLTGRVGHVLLKRQEHENDLIHTAKC